MKSLNLPRLRHRLLQFLVSRTNPFLAIVGSNNARERIFQEGTQRGEKDSPHLLDQNRKKIVIKSGDEKKLVEKQTYILIHSLESASSFRPLCH